MMIQTFQCQATQLLHGVPISVEEIALLYSFHVSPFLNVPSLWSILLNALDVGQDDWREVHYIFD